MKRYEKYKNSGVQWIGEVPSHWNPCRFKIFVSLINTPSTDDNKIGLENIESGTGHFKETDSEFEGNGVQFVEDDIVYGKLRPYLRKVWLATNKGNAVGDFFVFRANKSNPSYIHWLMLSDGFTSETNGSTYGAKMPRVSSDFILSMRYVLPPLLEQQAIASFLDAKTKPIDDIIAKREKQIELLEEMKSAIISRAVTKGLNPEAQMKDSGIEWIGEIPEGWDVIKTSFLFQLIGSGTTPSKNAPNYAEEGLFWLQTGDFNDNYVNDTSKYITDLAVQNCSALTLFPKGCLVIAMYGASIGKLGILNIESYTNQACCVLGREKNILIKFAFYAYKAGRKALINESRGGGQPNISQDIISHFKIPVPPINEQCNLIAYLDSETSKIDTRITKRRKQIELLQEYKQALITAAVTGKIDVREYNS